MLMLGVAASAAHAAECDAAVIDVTPSPAERGEAGVPPDIYIAPRLPMEAGLGNVFKVFRPGEVSEDENTKYPLLHYIGRLRIIDVQDEILVGRMLELASPQHFPRPRYETVMIGDCLLLEFPHEAAAFAGGALPPEPAAGMPGVLAPEAAEAPGAAGALAQEPTAGMPEGTAMQPTGAMPGAAGLEASAAVAGAAGEPPTIPSTILFRFDSADVDAQWRDNLEQMARFIAVRKPAKVVVEGHADWIGTDDYNIRLSMRRARAMVDYLVDRYGIDKNLFVIEAYGESRPAASNLTADGRRQNRRARASVLFKIIPSIKPAEPSAGPLPEPAAE